MTHHPPGRRGVSLTGEPTVSVVIASRATPRMLETCLASVMPQAARRKAEVIVARPGDDAGLGASHPTIRFVGADVGPDADLPTLRALGLAAASGDIVALTEDHCVVGDGWLDALVDAGRAHEVVAGELRQGPDARLTEWGAYFAEYGPYAGGTASDGAPAATGANVAYRRAVIDDVVALAARGEWENVVHRALQRQGSSFTYQPAAAVRDRRRISIPAFCRDRYAHGREFARRRLRDEPPFRRWVLLAGTWLLPLLLTGRLARAVRVPERGAFVRSLPLVFVFLVAWSLGEAAGYLLGPVPTASADG